MSGRHETLLALQRTAQFAAYERLFALWHVLHVPFVYLLGISDREAGGL